MTNYTPGPWTWNKDKPLLGPDGHNVNGVLRSRSELQSNRRLIASAPDLLEALQAVSRLDYLQEHNALAEKVRAAISKAEGGS